MVFKRDKQKYGKKKIIKRHHEIDYRHTFDIQGIQASINEHDVLGVLVKCADSCQYH